MASGSARSTGARSGSMGEAPGRCDVRTVAERGTGVRRMRRAATHPGEMLLGEFRELLRVSQARAARRTAVSANRRNEIVRGRRADTEATALCLVELPGASPEGWVRLQTTWDRWHAYRADRSHGAA